MEEIPCAGFLLDRKGVDSAPLVVHRPSPAGITSYLVVAAALFLHGSLAQDLPGAMTLVCEILTTDSEGSASRIAYEDFVDLYKFLAGVDGRISDDQVHAVLEYLQSDPV